VISGVLRRAMDGSLYLTDNGNLVLDVPLNNHHNDYEHLASALSRTPGVIDHGMFLVEATDVLVQRADGSIERLLRPPQDGDEDDGDDGQAYGTVR